MAEESTKQRENYVGKKPLDYSKWDDLDFESDEDDCHPNIEIGTWRRLKERMRAEKGIKKKEPYLVDKWNVTTTNKKYHIDPQKPPKTTEEQQQAKQSQSEPQPQPQSQEEQKATTSQKEEAPPSNDNKENKTSTVESVPKPSTESSKEPTSKPQATSAPSTKPPPTSNDNKPEEQEEDDEPYKARSNPQTFLDQHLEKLRKFAKIKKDSKADKFLKKNPFLVHEAAEGFLITHAVDRAVEGAEKPELARLSRRCLMIHNLVQSCSQQNVSPELGVERFYSKIASNAQLTESYKIELNKQVKELMERIEIRRVQRLAELQDIPDEYDEEEKAPLGPGGLDPTEVLNSLPKSMQDAFINQDIGGLKTALEQMDKDEAEYHMQRCIDAGLWVQPESDGEDDNDGAPQPQQQQPQPEQERSEPIQDPID